MDRRQALRLLALGAAAPAAVSPVDARSRPSNARFQHGVASGDPTQTSVIIWTRLTPEPDARGPFRVRWIVANDPAFKSIAAAGASDARADRDYTIKIDVPGLRPGSSYWYRFIAPSGETSTAGRTLTLPEGRTDSVVLAVASCASYEFGLFNAYDAIARLPRVDVVVHLGDYIYEKGPQTALVKRGAGRPLYPPHEIINLADYRARHAHYKTDPDLQAAHARTAWICTWDDHEAANDSWSGGGDPGDITWTARKSATLRAYYEWMPIREPTPGRAFEAINRTFQFGDLASLIMLETRLLGRSQQLDYENDMVFTGSDGDVQTDHAAFRQRLFDPARRMLGQTQQAWLERELKASVRSGRTWQVLGSQVLMGRVAGPDIRRVVSPAVFGAVMATLPRSKRARASRLAEVFVERTPYNLDAWDGYPAARERVYAACRAAGARPLVLSGDSHAFWANDLRDGAGRRAGVELGATAISSPGVCDYAPGLPVNEAFMQANPEVRFCDHGAKGFIVLTLTAAEAKAELVAVSTVRSSTYRTRVLKGFLVRSSSAGTMSGLIEA